MSDVIEFVTELLFEFAFDASKDKKVHKWIRYPLIVLFGIVFCGLFLLLLVIGFASLKTDPIFSSFLILLDIILTIAGHFKLEKVINKRENVKKRKR